MVYMEQKRKVKNNMKHNKDIKQLDTTLTIKRANVEGKTYYNLRINIDGMDVAIQTKFLNKKQSALLRHKLARLMGDEDAR